MSLKKVRGGSRSLHSNLWVRLCFPQRFSAALAETIAIYPKLLEELTLWAESLNLPVWAHQNLPWDGRAGQNARISELSQRLSPQVNRGGDKWVSPGYEGELREILPPCYGRECFGDFGCCPRNVLNHGNRSGTIVASSSAIQHFVR